MKEDKQNTEYKRLGDLTTEQINQIGLNQIARLKQIEQELPWEGFSGDMADYLADSHESLRELTIRLGVSRPNLRMVMDTLGIKRLSKSEALKAANLVAEPLSPEKDKEKRRKLSVASKMMWQDPQHRINVVEKVKITNQQEAVKLRRSAASRRRWTEDRRREHAIKQAEITKKQWEDPELRKRLLEGHKKYVESKIKVENPKRIKERRPKVPKMKKEPKIVTERGPRENRSQIMKRLWKNSDYRNKVLTTMENLRKDPEFRKKQLDGLKRINADSDFRKRRVEAVRKAFENPATRARQVEATRKADLKKNADPEFQARAAAGLRKYRGNPENAMNYPTNTIKGYRRDIGFEAISAWEANLARIFIYVGKEFYNREGFTLDVEEKYKQIISGNKTLFVVDFVTINKRGEIVCYEIMAHPKEDPMGIAKVEMFKQQYPEYKIKVISEDKYRRLRRIFEKHINSNPRFCGWEKDNDKLNTNPDKYQ